MNILVMNNTVPDANRCGADLRLCKLLRSLVELDNSVTLVAVKTASSSTAILALEHLGVRVHNGLLCDSLRRRPSQESYEYLYKMLAQEHFDIAIIALWFFGGFSLPELFVDSLWEHSPDTCIAVLTDDRHGDRQQQIADLDPSFLEIERAQDISDRETEVYRRCDCVIAISAADEEYVLSRHPTVRCFVVPFAVDRQTLQRPFESREGICFLGNFSNAANKLAYDTLLHLVLPQVRDVLGNISLSVGGTLSEFLYTGNMPNVHLLGHVEELNAFYALHRVFVAPTPFGTGITTKIPIAMSYGLPVVTTPAGGQSLGATPGQHLCIAESPADIASATIAVYSNPGLWNSLSASGLQLVQRVSNEEVKTELSLCLEWVQNTASPVRQAPIVCSTRRGLAADRYNAGRHGSAFQEFVNAAKEAMLRGDPNEALVQLRHALAFSSMPYTTSRCDADHYLDLLHLMKAAYKKSGDPVGLRRLQNELFWYQQQGRLTLSDEV